MDGANELLLGMNIALLLALIFALRKIWTIKAAMNDLKKEQPALRPQLTADNSRVNIVVTCISCGKHKIPGDIWLSHQELLSIDEQDDIIGGVCPDCRLPVSDTRAKTQSTQF